MKIKIEQGRKVLSLTENEYCELRFMVRQFDALNQGVDSTEAGSVRMGRKWCKAFGLPSYGFISKEP